MVCNGFLGSNQLAQTAWNICNDSFKTLLCVKYDSYILSIFNFLYFMKDFFSLTPTYLQLQSGV